MAKASKKAVEKHEGYVLAVDDDATSLFVLVDLLEGLGYEVLEASGGKEALDIIEREAGNLDVIVLDKMMPEMNGIEVVQALNDDPKARHIPVVMVTGSTKPEEVKEGIDAGVFYYLAKPFKDEVMTSVLNSAMCESSRRKTLQVELRKHQSSFHFIDKAEFTIKKMQEAESLACFIANCFPNPETALPGLAGLLANAVEHGNLGINFKDKSELLNDGRWREELEAREDMLENQDKVVTVVLVRDDTQTRATITDCGDGFEWADFMEIDPSRALESHGRGIAQANKISFDELIFNEKGNSVTAISKSGGGIKW